MLLIHLCLWLSIAVLKARLVHCFIPELNKHVYIHSGKRHGQVGSHAVKQVYQSLMMSPSYCLMLLKHVVPNLRGVDLMLVII